MTRMEAFVIIRDLPSDTREAIALFVETAEAQGGYDWNGTDSVFTDDANETLQCLAKEIRNGEYHRAYDE